MSTPPVRAFVAGMSALLALGCASLAVGHAGVELPLLSAIGPGGSQPVVPAAVAFLVASLTLGVVSVGVWRARSWAWALGMVAHSLVFLGAAVPYRGAASAIAMIIAGACVAILLTRNTRKVLFAR